MKKRGYLLLSILLISALVAYASHNSTVSFTTFPVTIYETVPNSYTLAVSNPEFNDTINNVTVYLQGFLPISINNLASWVENNYTGQALEYTQGSIGDDATQNFRFILSGNKVDQDTTFDIQVLTKDVNNDIDIDTLTFTVLNDSIAPSVTINSPARYSFVKNQTFTFSLTAIDAQSGIDESANSRIAYDDNNVPTSIANVYFNLSLDKNGNLFSKSFDPILLMSISTAPYLDFKVFDVQDKAGNPYVDSTTHHLYVDNDYPLVKQNFNSGFSTNNLSQGFTYNVSDNSFSTRGQLLFNPILSCNLYIQEVSQLNSLNTNRQFTNNLNNAIIISDLTGKEDGNYEAVLNCQDNATFSSQVSNTFTLDTKGPTISTISPSATRIANGSLITFTVSDVSEVSSVWYEWNNTNTTLNSPYSIDTSFWPEGSNLLRIYANDTLNNLNLEAKTYEIDSTNPTVSFLSPLDNSFSNSTISISYVANDTLAGDLSCLVLADSVSDVIDQRNVSANSITNFNLNLPNTGSWTLSAKCSDQVNYVGYATNITVTVDNTPPIISNILPSDLTFVNYTNINFNYDVVDNSGIKSCQLYINNQFNLTNSTEIQAVSNTFNQDLIEGINQWEIKCIDVVDNTASVIRNLTVDLTQPNITINYNKLTLEKQLDSIVTNFSVFELNKNFLALYLRDINNNSLYSTLNENEALSVSGLNLGIGNFTIYSFANDSASNSNSNFITFEILDNLAPVILSYSPSNNSALDSGTTEVNLTVNTDEVSNCRYSTTDVSYSNMTDMTITNSNLHSLIVATSAGTTYNYYIKCSDGTFETLSHYLTFTLNSAPSSPSNPSGGGGGGGGDDDEEEEVLEEPVNEDEGDSPELPVQQTENEENTNTDVNAGSEAFPEETSSDSPLTGFAILDTLNEYRQEGLTAATVIFFGILGTYGVVRFRRWNRFRMHRPPY